MTKEEFEAIRFRLDSSGMGKGWGEMKGDVRALVKEVEALNLQVEDWKAYASFLGKKYGELVPFMVNHHWVCPAEDVAEGKRLREKLGLSDSWQSEKRKDETRWCTCVPEKDGTHQPDCVGEREVLVKININGVGHDWSDSKPLHYEDILKLSGEREGASVVCKPADKRLASFVLCAGQSCPPTDGMKINCIMTGSA